MTSRKLTLDDIADARAYERERIGDVVERQLAARHRGHSSVGMP